MEIGDRSANSAWPFLCGQTQRAFTAEEETEGFFC